MVDLRQGDCLEIMKDIPDKSVDLLITDPPFLYGFKFCSFNMQPPFLLL